MKILCLFLVASIMFALANNIYSQEQKTNASLQSLVEAEKKFSATFAEKGFRDSFMAFFADDGIGFNPDPHKTRDTLAKAPADKFPLETLLIWQPVFADISASGDFGYTTGPLLITDQTEKKLPARHGMYFSVWKRQSDGSWKVVVDLGIGTPEAVAPINTGFVAAKDAGKKLQTEKPSATDYKTLDAEFSDDVAKNGIAKAYAARSNDETRIHRRRIMPVIGKDNVEKFFQSKGGKVSFKLIGGDIAKSNDLAFTYGSYQANLAEGEKEILQEGYYVHVWRRNKAGKWELGADVTNELPKERK